MAPANAEAGIKTTLLVVLIILLIMCGIMMPIKPITPQIETIEATIRDVTINKNFIFLSVFTPKVFDFSLFSDMALIILPDRDRVIIPMATMVVINGNIFSSKVDKLPISHRKAY